MARLVKIYDTTLRDGAQGEDISFSVEDKLRIAQRLDGLGVPLHRGRLAGLEPARRASSSGGSATCRSSTRRSPPSARRAGPASRAADGPEPAALRPRRDARGRPSSARRWPPRTRGAPHHAGREPRDDRRLGALPQAARRRRSSSTPSTSSTASRRPATTRSRACARPPRPAPTLVASATRTAARCRTRSPAGVEARRHGGRRAARHPLPQRRRARRRQLAGGGRGGRDQVQGTHQRLRRALRQRQPRVDHPEPPAQARACSASRASPADAAAPRSPTSSTSSRTARRRSTSRSSARAPSRTRAGSTSRAVQKNPETYEHIDPALVGNRQRVLVSDLSGRSNILYKAREVRHRPREGHARGPPLLEKLKELEARGYAFEGADASFELLMEKALGGHRRATSAGSASA